MINSVQFHWIRESSRFQTPAARFQEPRRDVRSGNNNIKAKKAPSSSSNGPDNKQKQHDNKRVNNQANNGVRVKSLSSMINTIFFRRKNINPLVPKKI